MKAYTAISINEGGKYFALHIRFTPNFFFYIYLHPDFSWWWPYNRTK